MLEALIAVGGVIVIADRARPITLWGNSLLKELDLVAALVVNLLMITLMLLDLYGIIDFGAFH